MSSYVIGPVCVAPLLLLLLLLLDVDSVHRQRRTSCKERVCISRCQLAAATVYWTHITRRTVVGN